MSPEPFRIRATAGFARGYESVGRMLAKLFGAAGRKPLAGLRLIAATDIRIDAKVFRLYGLTDAGIRFA